MASSRPVWAGSSPSNETSLRNRLLQTNRYSPDGHGHFLPKERLRHCQRREESPSIVSELIHSILVWIPAQLQRLLPGSDVACRPAWPFHNQNTSRAPFADTRRPQLF